MQTRSCANACFNSSTRPEIKGEKGGDKSDSSEPSGPVKRNRSATLRNATSQRRRFKERTEAWNVETPIDVLVGRKDQPAECDNPKAFVEVKERYLFENGNDSSAHSTSTGKKIEVSVQSHPILSSELPVKTNPSGSDGSGSQTNKSDSGGDETKNESSEEAEDEDEEEAQEDRNKAVEWTEDDQKNLMDLGLSEIERNRRLENLIARRRARKSYKRKVGDAPLAIDVNPPCQIPRIVATKNDPFDVSNSLKEMDGVPIPGSAPSVLLPTRNPFDLPYDPLEEKPNLMADSFQQEFTAAHQKEFSLFCRHESFCFGPAFLLGDEGGGVGYPRFRRPSDKGDHDWLIEQLLFKGDQVSHAEENHYVEKIGGGSFIQGKDSSQTKDDMGSPVTLKTIDLNGNQMEIDHRKEILAGTESEFEMESQLIRDSNDELSPSSSSENAEDVICVNERAVSQSFETTLSDALNNSLNCLGQKGRLVKEPFCDFSRPASERNKMENRLGYPDKVICHTPTYSIASDLQVEVSEIGSPPLTVDGNNSPTDGESMNQDWEIEKEMNAGGEESWGTPFDQLRVKEEEFKPRDAHEVSGENINNLGLLGLDLNSRNFASSEDMSGSSLEEIPNALTTKTVQSATHSTKELMDQPSPYCLSQEDLGNVSDDCEKAINNICKQKDGNAETDALGNVENMITTGEDIDGGLEKLMKQGNDGKKITMLEETDFEGRRSINVDSKDLLGHQSQKGSIYLNQIEDNGDGVEASVHDNNTKKSMPCETKELVDTVINVEESESQNSNDTLKLCLEKDSVSGFQSSNDTMDSISEQNLVIEGVLPLDASACRSPVSSKDEQIHADQLLYGTSHDVLTGEGHSGCLTKSLVNSASSSKLEDTTTQPSNASNVRDSLPATLGELEDITTQPSNASNVGESQEYNSPEKLSEEPILSSNPSELMEKDDKKLVHPSEVESEVIIDYSNLEGGKNCENTDQILSTPNTMLNIKMNISGNDIEQKISLEKSIEESILNDIDAKIIEKNDNEPVDHNEVKSEITKDLSEQNGDGLNLNAKNDFENSDQNLGTSNPTLHVHMIIPETIVEQEVATNPLIESVDPKIQMDIEPAPTVMTNNNNSFGSHEENEYDSRRFDKDNSEVEVDPTQVERNMEGNSKGLVENEVTSLKLQGDMNSSKLMKGNEEEGNVMGMQISGSGDENSMLREDLVND